MKRIFILLSLLLIGATALAQMPRTDMERLAYQDVDFNRVLTNTDNEVPVLITIGRYQFDGMLQLEDVTLSDKEIVKVIKDVWAQMDRDYADDGGFGPGFLGYAKHYASQFDLSPDINWPFVISNICQMATVVPGGVGTAAGIAADIINVSSGTTTMGDFFSAQGVNAANSALGSEAFGLFGPTSVGMGKMAGSILGKINYANNVLNAYNSGKALMDYFDRKGYLRDDDPVTQCLKNQMKIEDFYWRINKRLYQMIQEKGKGKTWKLVFDSFDNDLSKTLFGCMAPQTAHLVINMECIQRTGPTKDVRDWQGLYRGEFKLMLSHGMYYFDKEFKEKVVLNGDVLPFKRLASSGFFLVEDSIGEEAEVYKELSTKRYELLLTGKNNSRLGGYEHNYSLGGLPDKTYVKIDHVVDLKPEVGPVHEGIVDMPGLVHSEANFCLKFKQGTESNLRNLQVIVYDPNTTDFITFTNSGVTWLGQQFKSNIVQEDNTIIMTDRDLFKELRNGYKIKIGAMVAKNTPFK